MKISDTLLWDVDSNSIDYIKHAPFVVERVLLLSTLEDFFAIRDFYGKSQLKRIVKNLRHLDERTLSFCSIYLKVKPEEFRCCKVKQLFPSHFCY